jgi:AraC family transcriptional regulator, regulatory protein of adaptative response / methylated-DNA-[protein]-cysteine methyltransferase
MSGQVASGRQPAQDYAIVEKAIEFIDAHRKAQPPLGSIAAAVNLSEFHLQRLFSRWVGISPKRFLQFLTKEHAKKLLQKSKNLLDVTYDAGLSGPGRLHDLFVHCEAVTPGDYKLKGKGLNIRYGFAFSPFGPCMIASTDRGICALEFVRERTGACMVQSLKNQWPDADLVEDDAHIDSLAQNIFPAAPWSGPAPLHLYVKGTNFQIKVWEALLAIPFGAAVTYQAVADHIGSPGATRAVGTAIGKNPIAYIIPCHRVIRKMGDFGNYAGGRARKIALIGWESASQSAHAAG